MQDYIQQPPGSQPPVEKVRWLAVYNTAKNAPAIRSTCPSYGMVMMSTQLHKNIDGRHVYSIDIPQHRTVSGANSSASILSQIGDFEGTVSGDSQLYQPGLFAVNQPVPLKKDHPGRATQDWPQQVLCDITDDIPGVGSVVGPVHKSWFVSTAGRGFVCMGRDATNAASDVWVQGRLCRTIMIQPSSVARVAQISRAYDPVGTVASGKALSFLSATHFKHTYPQGFTLTGNLTVSDSWDWSTDILLGGTILIPKRDTVVHMTVNATVSSEAPDGAELRLTLAANYAFNNATTVGVSGGRLQPNTFRPPPSGVDPYDYFPTFFPAENIAFSVVAPLYEGLPVWIQNTSAYSVNVSFAAWHVYEINTTLPVG